MTEAIPGWKPGLFPDWTLKYKDRLQEIVEKTKEIARNARATGLPMPVYNDWRDAYVHHEYYRRELDAWDTGLGERAVRGLRRHRDMDGCTEAPKRKTRKRRVLAE